MATEERLSGLENFGNSCYCNSVLQALYFCKPFRDCILALNSNNHDLLHELHLLFYSLANNKRKSVIAPTNFFEKIKKENELFRDSRQQDAHEFFNFLINGLEESLLKSQPPLVTPLPSISSSSTKSLTQLNVQQQQQKLSWINTLFRGTFINQTKCLSCETLSCVNEHFLDLSVDIEQNVSLNSCLTSFAKGEFLRCKDKFFCGVCGGLQEAEKRMKILALPNILTIHLKRFKYQTTRYIKLSYRVLFPTELRLFNTADETENPDRLYLLFAVVVHIGNGPYHGHYITLIRSPATNQWYLFDDDQYEMIPESELEKYFGDFGKGGGGNGTGYIFFYQAADFDASELISTMKQGKTSSIPRSQTPSMSPRSNSQSTTTGSVNATSTTTYFDSKSDKTNFANNSDTQQQKFGNFFNIKKMKASAKANNSGVNSQSFSEKSESTLDQQLQVPLSTSVPNSQYSSRFDEYPPMPSTASSPIPAVSTPTTHEDDTNTSTSTPTYRDYRKQSTSGQSYASATTSSNVSVAIGSSGVGGNKSSGNLSYTTGVSANYSPSVPVSEYLSVSGSSDKLSKSNSNGNNGNGGNGGGMSGGSNVFKKVYKKFVSVSIPQTQGFEEKEKLDLGKSKSLGANVGGSSGSGAGSEENQSGGMSWNWKIKRDRAKSDVSSQK